ncbi:hypothetical protein [Streptomyces sp. FH025]|uniref:hypothetical protein n=1 Tax=Streptomyces sp. FH025 TaxID=2815937 RepID=UPI001A9F7685|nr:hypothetical protein [Streptomyces sp. FH025]MBO1416532.1 hypothetical protein [Streptomyces sp. FH025]
MVDRPVEVWRLPEEEVRAGRPALTWTVGPGGELAVLVVPEEYAAPAGSWPPVRLPFDGEVVVTGPRGEWRVPLSGVDIAGGHLALLPGGRVLLADFRADQVGADWVPNAAVYRADGTPERVLGLGDDIRALVTDRDGRIWMAYGDEGIYGDHPLAHHGLLGVDTHGRTVWRPEQRKLPAYPLEGLAGATEGRYAWLAWYPSSSGSHLTRIDPADGSSNTVRLPVRVPVGFAVRGREGVFLSRGGELTWHLLVGKEWKQTAKRQLRLPGELDRERAYGRDGVLWFRCGNGWYRVSV